MTIMYLPWEAQSETRAQAEADRKLHPRKSDLQAEADCKMFAGELDFRDHPYRDPEGCHEVLSKEWNRRKAAGEDLGQLPAICQQVHFHLNRLRPRARNCTTNRIWRQEYGCIPM